MKVSQNPPDILSLSTTALLLLFNLKCFNLSHFPPAPDVLLMLYVCASSFQDYRLLLDGVNLRDAKETHTGQLKWNHSALHVCLLYCITPKEHPSVFHCLSKLDRKHSSVICLLLFCCLLCSFFTVFFLLFAAPGTEVITKRHLITQHDTISHGVIR